MDRIVSAPGTATDAAAQRVARRSVLALGACSALGGCAWLEMKQAQLALRPTPGRPARLPPDADLFRPGDQRQQVSVPSAGGALSDRLALWWLPHADAQAPTLLYLHGSFRNLYHNLPKINALRDAGFAIVAVDYRGWGDSTAIVPSEATIAADARTAWVEVQQRQPDPRRRVIYGHSMGSAVAVRLASELHGGRDYAALAVESAFTRLPDVAAEAGLWGRIAAAVTTLNFDSLAHIGRIDAPLLMLHGTADRTVPVALGRRLRDAAPPGVRWVEVQGGSHSRLHSDAPELYRGAFQNLIRDMATDERRLR
jgi:pimeloyl-ACP methyl ester carboxylesterase